MYVGVCVCISVCVRERDRRENMLYVLVGEQCGNQRNAGKT